MAVDPVELAQKWDERHRQAGSEIPGPAAVLCEFDYLLPAAGHALDLACGRGGSAIAMAMRGLDVYAWDISNVAIDWLRIHANTCDLGIQARVRDVLAQPPPPRSFDVIVVSHFLDRPLCSAISAALRPGGLLFYQTFAVDAVSSRGPSKPEFRLAPAELLRLFPGLKPIVFSDLGQVGDTGKGPRDISWLVAER